MPNRTERCLGFNDVAPLVVSGYVSPVAFDAGASTDCHNRHRAQPIADSGPWSPAVCRPDRRAQDTVLNILSKAGLSLRFRFKTGPTVQALLWDNQTVIHLADPVLTTHMGLTGNGIFQPGESCW